MSAKNGKAGEKAGSTDLVPQEHGGAIYQGTPANIVPGTGRPPSRVKAALRRDFDERRHLLAEIADGVVTLEIRECCPECGYERDADAPDVVDEIRKKLPSIRDRLKAIEVMGRFSDLDDDGIPSDDLLRALAQAVLSEGVDGEVWERIEKRWVEILASRIA